jgi:hypothetical protein
MTDERVIHATEPKYGIQIGKVRMRIHGPEVCAGEACCFHNPSDHRLKDRPMNLRTDWGVPLVERMCEHGIGHPDPDSVAWLLRTTGQESWGIHGCDGCCFEARYDAAPDPG